MKIRIRRTAAMLALSLATAGAWAQKAPAYQPTVGQEGKDVVWVPTPQSLVDRMLEMAQVTPQDYLVDLGSGDGRTVITAAKRGVRAHGVEFNPDLVALSRKAAQDEGVSKTATFEQGDIFKTDFSQATVVTLFLLPQLNLRLRPILLDMKPGTRVVSNSFNMDDWAPDETAEAGGDCVNYCNAYKWVVPAKVQGSWQLQGKRLTLEQRFQKLEGNLHDGGDAIRLREARLEGARIAFVAGGDRYVGEVDGDTIAGTVNGSGRWSATRIR
ncbi:methyltransferase domain protein [Bordetella hinzii 1277]|uniref:SAM-dependent methyltransferase n=1 Tax=Bordetella hinzii TaxID=103855 RepID=UPI00045A80D7|nr:methyltransferase domain-containing protein [Bordetella hinzii]KCB47079.1 methyltransferase domain protein [Bordetella hinzii 1277]WPL79053.1 methyltransferase domain-containing protein [Bordetella hinzii]